MSMQNLLIQSGAVKPPSGISSWRGWPDHVRDTLLRWNHNGKLSFRYIRDRYPECAFCGERFTKQATVAVVYQNRDRKQDRDKRGRISCDPCLIRRAEESP